MDEYREALEFLELLRPGGPWVLTAIVPDGTTKTITATSEVDVAAFHRKYNGERNLYFAVNPPRRPMTRKAAKTDIAAIEYLLADLDPKPGETTIAAKARYMAALDNFSPEPTAIIDSGNGIQVLWRLAAPIELAAPITGGKIKGSSPKIFPAETAASVADVESRVKVLIEVLGGVAGTQNIDRILRLPGTINLPHAKKQREGRIAAPAKLIKFDKVTCALEDFPGAAAQALQAKDTANTADISNDSPDKSASSSVSPRVDWSQLKQHAGWLLKANALPDDFSLKGKMIIVHCGSLDDLNFDLTHAGLLARSYPSWSEVALALCAILKNDGRFSNEQIAAALMCDIDCNQHITKIKGEAAKRRAIERLILRSHDTSRATKVPRVVGEPDWRERRKNGSPIPSMHNARLAITAIGIECSYDTFHNEMLFGYEDDTSRHAVEHILGEMTDNGILGLRQLLSDHFGFDLTEKHVRDAVISLALERCFDPVADMLAKAELNWDGQRRVDRMAADYLNCEDTALNSAIMRKTMIAAVARVRRPGCKFDTIPVLESPEGLNKSSAWLVLAGDENFSDEKIIGKDSREVQEQLAGIWIHENADLAGMKKAEVETVKAFASRTVDRARPAYGHFLKKQARHSIEVGTTNSDEYLQSQTGNRRFWPLRVLRAIDLGKLTKDRLQLWGEAAHYQNKGESLTLDESMWADAKVEQESRRVKDPWEAKLENIPEKIETKQWDKEENRFVTESHKIIHVVQDQERVTGLDLLTHVLGMSVDRQTTHHTMRLSNVMKALGWQRTSNGKLTIGGQQVRGYFRSATSRKAESARNTAPDDGPRF